MNAELLKRHQAGLEALIRARRQFLARKARPIQAGRQAIHRVPDVNAGAAFPLTPALSLGEREKHSPVDRNPDALQLSSVRSIERTTHSPVFSFELPEAEDEASDTPKTGSRTLLFPPHEPPACGARVCDPQHIRHCRAAAGHRPALQWRFPVQGFKARIFCWENSLPEGEGQGEAKAAFQESSSVRKPESSPS
jgi:hypothetical protein